MENTVEKTYMDVFDINYFGALRLTKNVIEYMKETGGKIIYTSSGVGVMGFTKILHCLNFPNIYSYYFSSF